MTPTTKRSLLSLVSEVPALVGDLVRAELDTFKAELAAKGKNVGLGAGLLAAAGAFALFALGVLVATAVLALALVLPAWLAALIVAIVLLVLAGILALVGINRVKAGTQLDIDGAKASIGADIQAIKGVGNYDR